MYIIAGRKNDCAFLRVTFASACSTVCLFVLGGNLQERKKIKKWNSLACSCKITSSERTSSCLVHTAYVMLENMAVSPPFKHPLTCLSTAIGSGEAP